MRIGNLLHCHRVIEKLTMREFAKQLGVSAATLMRIERGDPLSGETLAAILRWMLGEKSN